MKKLMMLALVLIAGLAHADGLKLSKVEIKVDAKRHHGRTHVRADAVMGIHAFKSMQSEEMTTLLSQMIDQTIATNPGAGQPAIQDMMCFTGSSMGQMLNPLRKNQPMSCAMTLMFDANNPTLDSRELVKRYSIDKTDDPQLIE